MTKEDNINTLCESRDKAIEQLKLMLGVLADTNEDDLYDVAHNEVWKVIITLDKTSDKFQSTETER